MALLHFEGFDVSALSNPPWNGPTGPPSRDPPGRDGTGFSCKTPAFDPARLDLGSNPATVIVGFAAFVSNSLTNDDTMLELRDGSTGHIFVNLNSNGSFTVKRGSTILGTSAAGLVQADSWFHVQLKATINDSTGIAVLRINGFTVVNISNADTRNGAAAQVNVIAFGGLSSIITTCFIDDVYVCDDSGAQNNDFLGDVKVESLYPNAAGQYTEWTPSAGNNWACVDEPGTPNGDTDYVSSGTTGQRDLYNLGALLTVGGEVTDSGTRGVKLMLRSGATEVESAEFAVNTSYTRHESAIYELNPDTGAPFTISEVNAMQAGAKVSS
jgi:hypothetical protein